MKRSVPTIPLRRKREQKTNYRKRIALLKSGKNRLVVRLSNKYVTMQVISYVSNGDKIVKSCVSKELVKLGWKLSCKNVSAAYLTGLLLASKFKDEKNKECIVDFGLQTPKKGYNRLYAALKGAIEGGLVIPADKTVFPTDDQVMGKHKSEDFQKQVEILKTKFK